MKVFLSVLGIARRFCKWLTADLRNLAVAILAVCCVTLWSNAGSWERQSNRWQNAAGVEQAAHLGTILNYRIAAIHAQLMAIANRAAVEAQWRVQYQEAIHEKDVLQRDYRARLAIWLREQPTATSTGSEPGGADLSAHAGMPAGAVHDAAATLVPIADLERCAASFAQLAALIGFVEAASTVETSPDQSVTGNNP